MSELDTLIGLLAKLPGLGPRSARRAALHLIKRRESVMEPLAAALRDAAAAIRTCPLAAISTPSSVRDLPATRAATRPHLRRRDPRRSLGPGAHSGVSRPLSCAGRHVVALDGVGPEDLAIGRLIARLAPGMELILALNATVDGQTTAHYIADRAAATGAAVSRLAQGVPIGGELDYLDEGTLTAALKARRAGVGSFTGHW